MDYYYLLLSTLYLVKVGDIIVIVNTFDFKFSVKYPFRDLHKKLAFTKFLFVSSVCGCVGIRPIDFHQIWHVNVGVHP